MNSKIDKKLKQAFHIKHELYTKLSYYFPFFPPHRYVFILTNQCNLRCRNCYQDKNSGLSNALLPAQWIDLSNSIPAFSRITLTGGEPLLAPGFAEIFQNVAARHPCNLITNGVLLTQDLIELLVVFPKFKVLAISLDDLKSESASVRGLSPEQWGHLESMARFFISHRNERQSDCLLEIKTLILDENADKLFDIHKYCMEELKADQHTFQFLKGTVLQHSDKQFQLKEIFDDYEAPTYKNFDVIMQELERIKEYNVQNDLTAFLHPIVADLNTKKCLDDISFLNDPVFSRALFQPCKFPWSSLHINYDGEVFPCLSVSIGNIKEKPLKEILKGPAYKNFLAIIRRDGLVKACNRCGWLRPRIK